MEINTSLIAQVRQLQSVVTERDEALKAAMLENSRLETEAEGFSQRLKSLDESEQRYKDENWNLETQIQEMSAATKEATTREQKLQLLLATTTSEKSGAQRDLDDLKQNHGKLMEDFTTVRKNHDSELANLKKGINLGETERGALQRKVEDLTMQNQELAKAMAGRFRDDTSDLEKDTGSGLDDPPTDRSETEHSPPPSPTKGVPRHSMLESETLKSSLHHAHRMIQNLKGNVHREKNEKSELKRMLQEARDELDVRRRDIGGPAHGNKRGKSKSQQDLLKKPVRPNMLGAGRESKTDVTVDDAGWEEHNGERTPKQVNGATSQWTKNQVSFGQGTDMSDAYQTANETEDAFETANERDTTENESLSGTKGIWGESGDELTETEGSLIRAGTVRAVRPSPLTLGKARDRASFRSTASTSEDEEEQSLRTPVHTQPQRYRLKIGRGSRKSRVGSEPLEMNDPSSVKDSPASILSGGGQASQSLFAELGDLNGGESGEEVDGTPSRRSISSHHSPSVSRSISRQRSTQSLKRRLSSSRSIHGMRPSTALQDTDEPPIPKLPLIDSGTMTDPWEPASIRQPDSTSVSTSVSNEFSPTANYTPRNEDRYLQATSGSSLDTVGSSIPLRTAWDQSLGILSNEIPTFGNSSQPAPVSNNSFAFHDNKDLESTKQSIPDTYSLQKGPQNTEQQQDRISKFQSQKLTDTPVSAKYAAPALSLSSIHSLETVPSQLSTQSVALQHPIESALPLQGASATPGIGSQGPNTERILDSVFGPSKPNITAAPKIVQDESSRDFFDLPVVTSRGPKTPFREIPLDTVKTYRPKAQDLDDNYAPMPMDVADQSSQTVLSSEQIESMIRQKEKSTVVNGHKTAFTSSMKPLSEIGAISPTFPSHRLSESIDINKAKTAEQIDREPTAFTKGPKRPLSTSSIRSRTSSYPPLPPDHQQAIAAAAQKVLPIEMPTAVMGPPLAPASAYRPNTTRPRTPSRPRTPNQQPLQSPASKTVTTPRVRYSASRSQVSRRSSVSSFASELDERFNIRLEGVPGPYGPENGTDPRMIQAITQTMIGEWMWKYTRKAGRGDMSSNRHRRFFWVNPYTRTLYWSDKDPASAGRAELKNKSVAIESVQVVLDDNPMPLGLHRKSLVVYTPGRSVKFTAITGQTHETWFNALSYLLVRTGPDASGGTVEGSNIGTEDLEEFNPSYSRRASRTANSRVSLASFKSNASQRSLAPRTQSQLSTRQPTGASPAHRQSIQSSSINNRHSTQQPRHQPSFSRRLSEYWKPNNPARASMSSRSIPPQDRDDTQDIEQRDSAEDARAVIEQQEKDSDHLENVRACCDGT